MIHYDGAQLRRSLYWTKKVRSIVDIFGLKESKNDLEQKSFSDEGGWGKVGRMHPSLDKAVFQWLCPAEF